MSASSKRKDFFLRKFFRLFFQNHLMQSAAEMAFFCIFAFFPLLMVLHASFSIALVDVQLDLPFLQNLLPKEIVNLLDSYINQIQGNSDVSFLILGGFLTIYTLTNFMRSTKRSIRNIYHSHGYGFALAEWIVSLIFALLFLVLFIILLILLIMSGQILGIIESLFPWLNISILKSVFRYIFTGIVVYTIITLFYLWIPNIPVRLQDIFPGTLFTSVFWVFISFIFAFYMNNFAHYSIIYGSIGAFIMLLLWIYISCIIILSGALINYTIYAKKQRNDNVNVDKK